MMWSVSVTLRGENIMSYEESHENKSQIRRDK